jgi:hypothetical protein
MLLLVLAADVILYLFDVGVYWRILALALAGAIIRDSAHLYARDVRNSEPLLPTSSVLWSGFPR